VNPSAAVIFGTESATHSTVGKVHNTHRCFQALLFLMYVASLLAQEASSTWAGSPEADPVLIAVPLHHFVTLHRSLHLTVLPIMVLFV